MRFDREKPVNQPRDKIQPVQLYFSPTWYHFKYGVDYSEPTWRDPIARVERYRELDRLLFDRFGDIGMGSKDPAPAPSCVNAYGHYIAAALFGCHVTFLPRARRRESCLWRTAPSKAMRDLKVPDLQTNPVSAALFRRMEDPEGEIWTLQGGHRCPQSDQLRGKRVRRTVHHGLRA